MGVEYKAWPFREAQALLARYRARPTRAVAFQTGFGPSGLPHIGTFAEVARTTWVRRSFSHLTGYPTRQIAFSDDMDGLRKVPLNLPQPEMLAAHLGKPLSRIPDPYGCCESYSAHMNNQLQQFLSHYGFQYEFQSSSEAYARGDFDAGLKILLERDAEVKAIILPTLGEEKQADWSPFFPICRNCGRVYSTRVLACNPSDHTIAYACDREDPRVPHCGHRGALPVTGGHVKVGWKVDWALRWYSYEIAYEMYGKDLIESARLSARIVKLMGKRPPNGFFYEMFLDEQGQKISKSVGRGVTVDTWIKYASLESLLHFIYQTPQRQRRLYFDVIPKSVDDYLAELRAYHSSPEEERPNQAIWHIHNGGREVPDFDTSVNFSLINNVITGIGADEVDLIADYLERYDPSSRRYHDTLLDLVQRAVNYYQDFILPSKHYRAASEAEKRMFAQLRDRLVSYQGDDEKEMQAMPFDVARANNVEPAAFFKSFYEVVFGQERGSRFGTFVKLVGKERALELLQKAAS